ncbi:MAG: sulfur carrier protein ThiS [Comamonadaceae bacterium]|nr:MAG: sulfur carrier protein ThiS [Comamonadaceae bacterium]
MTTTIHLNKDSVDVPDGTTLADLLATLGKAPAALATAVNGDFVPRGARASLVLRHGDAVTTFEPITGG